jgi:hypothetical protein
VKYRVHLFDHDTEGRHRHHWHEDFDTRAEAEARIREVNAESNPEHTLITANMHVDVIGKKHYES